MCIYVHCTYRTEKPHYFSHCILYRMHRKCLIIFFSGKPGAAGKLIHAQIQSVQIWPRRRAGNPNEDIKSKRIQSGIFLLRKRVNLAGGDSGGGNSHNWKTDFSTKIWGARGPNSKKWRPALPQRNFFFKVDGKSSQRSTSSGQIRSTSIWLNFEIR